MLSDNTQEIRNATLPEGLLINRITHLSRICNLAQGLVFIYVIYFMV
jgi:hypothetical protein